MTCIHELLFYSRVQLTGLLYTATVNGSQVHPDYIPTPVSQATQGTSNTREYTGVVAYRRQDLHHIKIRGRFDTTTVGKLELTLARLWKNATAGNL